VPISFCCFHYRCHYQFAAVALQFVMLRHKGTKLIFRQFLADYYCIITLLLQKLLHVYLQVEFKLVLQILFLK